MKPRREERHIGRAASTRGTVASCVSTLRSMGEFLVRDGIWRLNPLRWMRGAKIDNRQHLSRRIGSEQLRALWSAAQSRRQAQARYQAVCLLGILYATGLRRGELERLGASASGASCTSPGGG